MKKNSSMLIDGLILLLWSFGLLFLGNILKINPIFILVLLSTYAYLKFTYKKVFFKPVKILDIGLLFVVFFVISRIIILDPEISNYFIPIAALVMSTNLLFNDLHLGFVVGILASLTVGLILGNNFGIALVFVVTALVSNLLVWNARTRSGIIKAGFLGGVVQFLCIIFLNKFQFTLEQFRLAYFVPVFSGLFSGIAVAGTLPIFEYLFKVVTNISLLEMADYRHPLLQKMSLEAPGTYHHSLIVSNLAEVAAEAVGANSLLVRVGSYYHDIGKIEKSDYFSENQIPPFSKHDTLNPSISKLLIINHVKEGIELAKKYRLNSRIIDFILEHHGTSLVYYFFIRALEKQQKDEKLDEEHYRYPGPKPQSRETAIVLLADSVEAASRTIEEPTPSKIEDLTRKIINNKFIDGQLDECELTLKNLEKIAKVFSRTLIGIYHARIKYPKQKSNADLKKSAEKGSAASKEDTKNHTGT